MDSLELDLNSFVEEPNQMEDESDLEKILMPELQSAIVQATDWTTDTLISQIEKGRIQLDPDFQRRDAWNDVRKSRLIESLMLGFPVPQIVLAEAPRDRSKYIVIDGKQRLLTLVQFAGSAKIRESFGTLKLTGLEILSQLNRKTKQDLTTSHDLSSFLVGFENTTIRTVVIRHWKRDIVLYHIFLRLNTGSVQLSPQELRNALHPGPFAKFIDKYSGESPGLRRILKTTKPDFRMRDAELLLRYYAFRNFLSRYRGSMKDFLDYTTQSFNDSWDSEETVVRAQADDFEGAVELTFDVFGDHAFRKWKDGDFYGRFNRAVFDVMMYHFCRRELHEVILRRKERVKDAFVELSRESLDFVDSIEATTKSIQATVTRFSKWTEALSRALDVPLPVPTLSRHGETE